MMDSQLDANDPRRRSVDISNQKPDLEKTAYVFTKEQILDLAVRVKHSDKIDRELDGEIARAFGWVHKADSRMWGITAPHWWKNNRSAREIIGLQLYGQGNILPFFTISMDAAMSLVPSWLTVIIIGHENRVKLVNGIGLKVNDDDHDSVACSIPCAIVVACLKHLASNL